MDEIRINDIDGDRLTVKDATTGARRILSVIAKEMFAVVGYTSVWVPLLLDTAAVATLRDALTAWLDAPRDGARAEAEAL